MQAPFASDMLAAPTGTAVAWVFNAKGCSNIWVADPTHGAKARQITPYTEDAGFDIGELSARLNRAVWPVLVKFINLSDSRKRMESPTTFSPLPGNTKLRVCARQSLPS